MQNAWRVLALVLGIALLVAGCGGQPGQQAANPESEAGVEQPESQAGGQQADSQAGGQQEPIEIEFWNYWDGNDAKALEALIEQFNAEHPNIRVKSVYLPWGELLTKIQASIAGNTPPPVAAGDLAWMAKLHRSGALRPLDDVIEERNIDLNDFYPALLEYDRYEGRIQALPVSTNNLGLFYNKDLFRQAGLDPEDPPETWDELREAARTIAGLGGGIQGFEIYTVAGDSGEGLTWQFQPYLWQAGAEYLADNYSRPGFNNAQGKQALQFLVDIIHEDKAAQPGQWGAFDKGQAGMRVDGSWMVSIWKDNAPFEFGTAMIPIPEGGQHATNMGGEHVFVFKTTPEIEAAAIEFALWLTSTEVQVEWDMATAFMPVRKSVASHPRYREWLQQEPRLIPFVEQQPYARPRPPIPEYPETSLAFAREIEKAFFGAVSVDEALANAERAVLEALQQ